MTVSPLGGIRVLELGQAVAGPLCARLLADSGAEVVKVESPDGDMLRRLPQPINEWASTSFGHLNWGKRSIALDLALEDARDVMDRLLARADVFVTNLSPGALGHLGLSAARVRLINERIIDRRFVLFGAKDPLREVKGYGLLAEARVGLSSLVGDGASDPASPGFALGDFVAGYAGATSVCLGVLERQLTGTGSHAEIAIADALGYMLGVPLAVEAGRDLPGANAGHGPQVNAVPSGFLRARDNRTVAYTAFTDGDFNALAKAMRRPDLVTEFPSVAARRASGGRIYALVNEWGLSVATAGELELVLREHGVPAVRVRELKEYLAESIAGSGVPTVRLDLGDDLRVVANPLHGIGSAEGVHVPDVGEHSRVVLREWVEADEREIESLLSAGAVTEVNRHEG